MSVRDGVFLLSSGIFILFAIRMDWLNRELSHTDTNHMSDEELFEFTSIKRIFGYSGKKEKT